MIQLTAKREKAVVGLEIEADSVAAAEVQAGSAQLSKAAIAPLPEGAFRDGEVIEPDAVAETLRTLFADNKLSKRVRLGIANQRVVVRTLRLPAIDDPKELDAAVRFQAQEQVPMPLEQAVLDHRVVGGIPATEDSAPMIDVLLVAARREMIDASLLPLRRAGLRPIGIDLSAFGLIRALGDLAATSQPEADSDGPTQAGGATLYCNVGETTNLAVSRRRSCLFTRVAPVGIGGIAAELSTATGLAPEHARMWMNHVGLAQEPEQVPGDSGIVVATREALQSGVGALQGELRLSLDFYAAREGAEPVDRVVLCGPGSAIPGFGEAMGDGFAVPFELGRPTALAGFDATSAARLTLSYGLALEA